MRGATTLLERAPVRWAAVVPGAILGSLLALTLVHAWLSLFWHREALVAGHIEPIERLLTPFVLGFFFVLAGTAIAPSRKARASLLLGIAWVAVFGALLFLWPPLLAEFGYRSVGALAGPVAGRVVALRRAGDA